LMIEYRRAPTTDASRRAAQVLELDVADAASVQSAAERVAEGGALYGLCNNAGVGFGRGFDETLATNLYGARTVCEAFLPLLRRHALGGGGARVVNIASASGPNFVSRCGRDDHRAALARPDESTLDELWKVAEAYAGLTDYDDAAYGLSKACLNAYTYHLAQAEAAAGVLVNSCTPGYILTDLTRGMGATNPPEKGTLAPCYLLMDDALATLPPGRFYGSDAQRSPLDVYRAPGSPPYEGPP